MSNILQTSGFYHQSSHSSIMPSPGSMPKPGSTTQRSSPQNEDGGVIKSTPKKTNEGVKKADENPLPTPAPSLPFTCFPAEIQQGIWIEAIKGPSCHHFNLRKAGGASPQDRWVVHVHEKPKNNDASAYRHWKSLFQVRDRAFLAAFHYHNSKSNIQPITLRRTIKKRPTYMTSAAIDVSEDLVILYLDHGPKKPATFTWFEHMDPHRRNTMDIRYIQMRLEPFRKVAIHYKDGFPNACRKGPFSCYCPDTALNCGQYKACPRELACFLDCFKNLEAFYFVVELKTKAQQTFAAHIKSKSNVYCLFFSLS